MWNQKRYDEVKSICELDLKRKIKKTFNYMIEYICAIVKDDFEAAKAITDVLKPLNYETSDTHQYIKELVL